MKSFINFVKGIVLRGETTDPTDNTPGSVWHNSTTGRIKSYVQSAVRELVSTDQTQTLTNKSVDGATNTLTNIPSSAISSVARAKIDPGTPDQVVINNGSGNLSSEAALAKLRGGTGADNSAVTFPSTGVIVTEAAVETLTNKTLTSPVINTPTGITKADVGLSAVDNTSDATKNAAAVTLTNKTLTAPVISTISNASATLTLPTLTTTLVGRNTTDLLTNKTLVDSSTSIVDQADNTKFLAFEVAGTTGTSTTIANTQTANRTLTLPDISDTLVSKNSVDILQNKNLNTTNGNVFVGIPLSTAVAGQLPIANGGTGAATKVAGFDALSPMTTSGDLIYGGAAGTGTRLSAGLANQVLKTVAGVPTWSSVNLSGINYVSANPDAEVDTTGWATYADAANTSPVDGTGGTPNVTFTRSTSSPLRGTASFLFTKDAANRQGQGVSFTTMTIDNADQGKVLSIQADYTVVSGTFADGDLGVYIYDITNAQVIYPNVTNINNTGLNAKVELTFQTNINSVSYRLILHVQSVSALAYVLKFDNFSVGPQLVSRATLRNPVGTIIHTPSLAPPSGYLYADGSAVSRTQYAALFAVVSTTYGAGDGSTTFNIPDLRGIFIRGAGTNTTGATSGFAGTLGTYQADQLRAHTHTSFNNAGYGGSYNASAVARSDAGLNGVTGSTGGGETRPANVALAAHICFDSGNVAVSSEVSGREISAKYSYSSSPTIAANTAFAPPTKRYDYGGSYNPSTGEFTALETARYSIIVGTAANGDIYLWRNGVQDDVIFSSNSSYFTSGTVEFDAIAGQKFTVRSPSALTWSASTAITFKKLNSGSQQIAASEFVGCKYTSSAGQAFSTIEVTFVAGTKVYDSHGRYNTSTGVYTCPANGKYRVSAHVRKSSGAGAAGNAFLLGAKQNSNATEDLFEFTLQVSTSNQFGMSGATTFDCITGDTLQVRLYGDTAVNLSATAENNSICIERIGT